jgi:DNA recombination-dependent growth factor C
VWGVAEEVDDQARAAADAVLAAVRGALRELEAIQDTAVRARAAGLVLREWAGEKSLPKEIRQQAVAYMHEQLGMDFPEIGAAIGTDRSRAWRIWKGM